MATYRALADIDLGKNWPQVQAGTILTDQPPVPNIPVGWSPPGAVEPLDAGAVTAFWNAGVQFPGGPIRPQWSGVSISPPTTKWIVDPAASPGNPYRQYVLSGLGAGLGMVQLLGTRGVQP